MDATKGGIVRILDTERPKRGMGDVWEVNGHVMHMVPRSFVAMSSSACLFLEVQVFPS